MKKVIIAIFALGFSLSGYAQTHLTLEQSKSLALQNNSKVKNSELEVGAAQEIKKEAYTNYFPKVSATAMGMQAIDPLLEMKMQGGNLPVYDGNPANLGNATQFAYMPDVNIGLFNQMALGYINVLQPVYAGGKIKTGNKMTDLNIEVKQKLQKLSENEVLLKTEQQYWQVIAIQEKQKTLDNYIKFLDTLYNQTNTAYKNGVIIKNDVLKVTIKQSELKVNKTQLENGKKLSLMQLCQTIGMEYDPEIILDDNLNDLSVPQTYFVSNSAVLPNRVEYQLLEKAVTGAKLETQLKKGDYLPTFGVGLSGYYLDQFESNQKGAFNGMVYASLSVPISDWWGGKHKLNELKYKEKIAQNTLNDNKGLLNLQMEKAWTDLTEADKKVHLIEETLAQTIENLKVNQDSYNNGLIQLSDLLEARALKAETEDKLIEAKSQYKTAITNYLLVTGR
ncbi:MULTISPECIES: TolC family protein [Bacteroidota]|uniref:Outer membrane protein TolC n=1 Tax=Epilithonimonas hungarica TaxID=454006 RepID=A0A1G7S8D2_9FLAO|nr:MULTISPECIES: TolC family protein [Bacteroidota]SDG19253.1 Outer membrane protein TolC [Epilithonimonas hungarica]